MRYEEYTIEGRNAVTEAFRSGKTIDKLFVLDGCQDGPVKTILREAKKSDTIVNFVKKERLDQLSENGKHQGVIFLKACQETAQTGSAVARANECKCQTNAAKGDNAPANDLFQNGHKKGKSCRRRNRRGGIAAHYVKTSHQWNRGGSKGIECFKIRNRALNRSKSCSKNRYGDNECHHKRECACDFRLFERSGKRAANGG